ncbi:twin transmembrane helix small protein [Nitrococcus mobilis]|uniref:Putative transmembrane protein n=1 Tax=Nitrococcus mobilis Nb-231 TaxID=314278 RepID=A4BQR9_9GAMM|nr:twin transmembrane helix small protein [Nitrococcus mobilis]EAR21919.1 putative transmembrane protein [Nitrococcus mobilis Nb-231]
MAVLLIKIGIVITLIAIFISLMSAGFFLVRDGSKSRRMLQSLTLRITLSVVLFALILILMFTGVLPVNRSPLTY